jgi:hypothetical protein
MLVLAGGKDLEHGNYQILEKNFLTNQQFFGKQLKIKFNQELIKAFKKGILKTPNKIKDEKKFINFLYNIKQDHWIVSIQKPLDDVEQIVRYVGRYTKRACISEYKIEEIQPNIKFKFNDYKNTPRGEKPKVAIKQMKPFEFLDQLLQHVPNKRFMMVRYFGLYNSRYLKHIPKHLKLDIKIIEFDEENVFDINTEFWQYRNAFIKAGKPDPLYCTFCKQDMIFYAIKYKNKIINNPTYDDSS